jgi:hypothetical protein
MKRSTPVPTISNDLLVNAHMQSRLIGLGCGLERFDAVDMNQSNKREQVTVRPINDCLTFAYKNHFRMANLEALTIKEAQDKRLKRLAVEPFFNFYLDTLFNSLKRLLRASQIISRLPSGVGGFGRSCVTQNRIRCSGLDKPAGFLPSPNLRDVSLCRYQWSCPQDLK